MNDVSPWPGWVRYTLLAVLFAVVGTGLVVALYDYGFLPIAGPFVLIFLLPLLLPLQRSGLRRRAGRLAAATAQDLTSVASRITTERSLAPEARATRGSDESLTRAAHQLDSALQKLRSGHERDGATAVAALARTAQESWAPDAPLSKEVADVATKAERLHEALRRTRDSDAPSR